MLKNRFYYVKNLKILWNDALNWEYLKIKSERTKSAEHVFCGF